MLPSQILLSTIVFSPREECSLGLFFSDKIQVFLELDCKSVLEGELTRGTKDDPSKELRFKYYRIITQPYKVPVNKTVSLLRRDLRPQFDAEIVPDTAAKI